MIFKIVKIDFVEAYRRLPGATYVSNLQRKGSLHLKVFMPLIHYLGTVNHPFAFLDLKLLFWVLTLNPILGHINNTCPSPIILIFSKKTMSMLSPLKSTGLLSLAS